VETSNYFRVSKLWSKRRRCRRSRRIEPEVQEEEGDGRNRYKKGGDLKNDKTFRYTLLIAISNII